ncbi:unnamed protein product [Litomosoides sigmodontis]|uniref:Glutamyl-tRNA(Gln) amidotransferase subunit C, mitochondrial n=1 Tax=Litomosoides sigmodontis TaxID=42156 RepID=A0A3P6T7R6_LITSI|nr:unnamed protein product [Litomosoides sigmodontis]
MNLPVISFQLILQQRLRSLRFADRYKSRRSSRCYSAAANSPDEQEGIYIDQSKVEEPPVFDRALITHLERLSLVRFSDEQAVFNLKQAVRFANQLKLIDTTGIKPLETLLENIPCPLREDVEENPVTKAEVLVNAARTVEDYFVVPLGNIPLEESNKLDLAQVEDFDRKVVDKEDSLMDSGEK